MRLKGTIKWFSTINNYGFITNQKGEDVYFKLENITSSKDELDKDKPKSKIIPENGDKVEYTEYTVKGNLRAKKVVINQRSKSQFLCPHCHETIKPKIIFDNSDLEQPLGKEFQQKKPMHTICPNCFAKLEEYETSSDRLSIYNRSAILLLILLVMFIFGKMFLDV